MATLIFDEECPYCKSIAISTGAVADLEVISYQSEKAQEMLEEAFEKPGFTLYLFEDDRVYWGREAARKAAEKTFLPSPVFMPAIKFYPQLVKIFSVLSRRSGVKQPVCTSDRCMANEEGGGMKKLQK